MSELTGTTVRWTWKRKIVALFFVFHSIAVLHTLVPDWGLLAKTIRYLNKSSLDESTAERLATYDALSVALPPRRPLDAPFYHYKVLSGTQQDWQMFHTSPRDEMLEVEVHARDIHGKTHRLGAMLPDFSPVDVRGKPRHFHLWARLEFWNEQKYVHAFLDTAGRLLKQSESPQYVDLTLVLRKHMIQDLDTIKKTGEISRLHTREFWLPRDQWKDPEEE